MPLATGPGSPQLMTEGQDSVPRWQKDLSDYSSCDCVFGSSRKIKRSLIIEQLSIKRVHTNAVRGLSCPRPVGGAVSGG